MALRRPLYEVEVVGADGERRLLRLHAINKRTAIREVERRVAAETAFKGAKADLSTLRLIG